MKKICNPYVNKPCAFSLAEALITLLIVCLITLASIPVLTKKKRTITDNGSGQWICTLAEQKDANGNVTGYKHVYWDSQTSDGDINDPLTWDVAGDGTSCTFAPPLKAKNFTVTLIGGGGGGADGKYKTEMYLNESTTATEELPAGEGYNVALFGGGGGGYGKTASSLDNGGSGAAGSYFYGSFELKEPMRFFSEIGQGGATRSGLPHNSNAESGGSSILRDKYGNTLVTAPGGGGGYSTKSNVYNPNPFVGPLAEYPVMSQMFKTLYKGEMLEQGVKNEIDNPAEIFNTNATLGNIKYYDKLPVKGFYKKGDSLKSGPYGNGGKGYNTWKNPATAGSKGAVFLWKNFINVGQGGNASPLQTNTLSTIKGKLVVTIGQGGTRGQDGKITTATIYDTKGKVVRTLKSAFGTKGLTADKDVGAELIFAWAGGQSTLSAKAGQNSFWKDKGGGTPGTYRGYHVVTIPKKCDLTVTETVGHYYNPGCVRVAEVFNPGEIPSVKNGTRCSQLVSIMSGSSMSMASGSSSSQQAYPCIGYKMDRIDHIDSMIGADGNRLEGYNNPDTNWKNESELANLLEGNYSSQEKFNAALSKFNLKNTGWSHSDSVAYSAVAKDCYNWANPDEKNSLKDIKYTHTIKNGADCPETKTELPKCTAGGNGTYYGAGGGGGAVGIMDYRDIFGENFGAIHASCIAGNGAPGAVIVEW